MTKGSRNCSCRTGTSRAREGRFQISARLFITRRTKHRRLVLSLLPIGLESTAHLPRTESILFFGDRMVVAVAIVLKVWAQLVLLPTAWRQNMLTSARACRKRILAPDTKSKSGGRFVIQSD